MTDLERRLRALRDEVEPVDAELDVAHILDADHPEARPRMLPAAAAILVVIVASVLVIAPARTAVADWLGIGSTSVDIEGRLPAATTTDPPASPSEDSADAIETAASAELGVAVLLPRHDDLGTPVGWEFRTLDGFAGPVPELVVDWRRGAVDRRSEGGGEDAGEGAGTVRLTAWPADAGVALRKIVTSDPVADDRLVTDGDPALWVGGPHVRDLGEDAVLVEPTLLWVRDGVEYRLSGVDLTRDRAIEIATTQG